MAEHGARRAAYVGLGANLGDPAQQVRNALMALQALKDTAVTAVSPFYRSPAIGPAGQPDYCNAVAALSTGLLPDELLRALQKIEADAGRVRAERWGARTLDLDLLLHGDTVRSTSTLTLPHPEIARRDFVLKPLLDVAPAVVIPGIGRADAALAALPAVRLEPWT